MVLSSTTRRGRVLSSTTRRGMVLSSTTRRVMVLSSTTSKGSVLSSTTRRGMVLSSTTRRGMVLSSTTSKGSVLSYTTRRGMVLSCTTSKGSVLSSTTRRGIVLSSTTRRRRVLSSTKKQPTNQPTLRVETWGSYRICVPTFGACYFLSGQLDNLTTLSYEFAQLFQVQKTYCHIFSKKLRFKGTQNVSDLSNPICPTYLVSWSYCLGFQVIQFLYFVQSVGK